MNCAGSCTYDAHAWTGLSDNSLGGTFTLNACPLPPDLDPIFETPGTLETPVEIPERLPWKNIFLLHSILQLPPGWKGYFISWVFKFFKITSDVSLTRGAWEWVVNDTRWGVWDVEQSPPVLFFFFGGISTAQRPRFVYCFAGFLLLLLAGCKVGGEASVFVYWPHCRGYSELHLPRATKPSTSLTGCPATWLPSTNAS